MNADSRWLALVALVALAASAPALAAQTLVENINQQSNPSSEFPEHSAPLDYFHAGGWVYFSAVTGPLGRELYRADAGGGSPVLVADIYAGDLDSYPRDFVELPDGRVLFTADSADTGREIWVTDGTTPGTQMVVELTAPGGYTFPTALTLHQGEVYFFAASDAAGGRHLWKTDGTAAGTIQIEDLGYTGGFSTGGEGIASTSQGLFYTYGQSIWPDAEWYLYLTDGSVGGATLLLNQPEASSYGARELTAAGANVVWFAQGVDTDLEPWVSDGTVAGTQIVEQTVGPGGSNPASLISVGDEVYFVATHPTLGREVFRSDGTPSGTDVVTNTGGSSPFGGGPLVVYEAQGQVFFSFYDANVGYELWSTTGAFDSETLYADFAPGSTGSYPAEVVPFGGGIVCRASTDATGAELYFSAGTPGTTFLIEDIFPGDEGSGPSQLTAVGDKIWFAATGASAGQEPWISDGSPQGTALVADLAAVPFDQSSLPDELITLGDRVVFTANDGLVGEELWVSDGTAAGTQLVLDISSDETFYEPRFLLEMGGRVYFRADDGVVGNELWSSDGTPSGTQVVADLYPGFAGSDPFPFTAWRGDVYFMADTTAGEELWATDGTAEGTRLLADIEPGWLGSYPSPPVPHLDYAYFSAGKSGVGRELYRTDGTPSGTELVVDLNPGPGLGADLGHGAVSFGDYLYFSGTGPDGQNEVYRTDGTAAGTTMAFDLNGSESSIPYEFHVVGDRMVFAALIGTGAGSEWHYHGFDGTTVEQLSFAPNYINGNWNLYPAGDRLVGMLRGANGAFDLWGTDGSAAGSGVIKQIHPDGTEFVNYRAWRLTSGPNLVFNAGDDTVGSELWVTDGTTAGTFPITDLNPGPTDSHPGSVVRLGTTALFHAWTPEMGWELYSLPMSGFPDWVAEPFGIGCAGSDGLAPTIGASGSAELGSTLNVEVEGAAPLSILGHYYSPQYALASIGGCTVHLATPNLLASGISDGAGESVLALPVPSDAALAGAQLWLQSIVVDPGGELLGVASVTPALEVVVAP